MTVTLEVCDFETVAPIERGQTVKDKFNLVPNFYDAKTNSSPRFCPDLLRWSISRPLNHPPSPPLLWDWQEVKANQKARKDEGDVLLARRTFVFWFGDDSMVVVWWFGGGFECWGFAD